jgi:isoleucyl-tRNA synthetase
VTADELAGLTCAHPLRGAEGANGEWDDDVRDFRADHVTDEEGTGFVHTAPSHGMEDELTAISGMLDQVMTYNVLDDGSFRADLPFFGGKRSSNPRARRATPTRRDRQAGRGRRAARTRKRIKHSYPHSWRSKAPVIYRNTPQWFAAIDKPLGDGMDDLWRTIRERALTSIDELVKWTPQTGRNRLYSMIEAGPTGCCRASAPGACR